jgi:hypothetical protein
MKELETPTQIEIKEDKQVEKLKFVGQAILKRGHRCWELEIETGNIIPATFEKQDIHIEMDITAKKRKVVMKEGCLYFNGLNRKSVIKQMNNLLKVQNDQQRSK